VPVIFDLDGTLVDPAGGITDGIAAALVASGLPVPDPDLLAAMIGPKLSDSLLTVAMVPADKLDDVIRLYRQHYLATGIAQSRLYPGIKAVPEGPVGKADIIAAALDDLSTQHAVMVGDRAQDVAGAIANGLDCIGVGWGFAPDGELEVAGAVTVVENTVDMVAAIERLEAIHTAAMSEVRDDGIV
jgi:phosphoglycolate phosphatase